MTGWSLRAKMLVSVSLIIFVVLGTSTLVHIQFLQQEYFQSIEWRSEALAQGVVNEIVDLYKFIAYMPGMLEGVSLRCDQLYASNKEKNVTHVAVIAPAGTFAVHSDKKLLHTSVQSPLLQAQIANQRQTTILINAIYHTLIPVFGTQENRYLGAVDIGFPKKAVDEKITDMLLNSLQLFAIFLMLAFVTTSFLTHVLLTRPVKYLVSLGQRMADGHLIQTVQSSTSGDEIAVLGTVFYRIAHYLQQVTLVAAYVSTGVLDGEVHLRSDQDALGKAMQDMLNYLRHVAAVARKIASGDLTERIQIRSRLDAFGQTIQSMMDGLRSLIVQIRSSADQIATTGKTISSLTMHDIAIVEDVQTSAATMKSTLFEMGESVADVARNAEVLSLSVTETSTSVLQMTASIAHITSNTQELTGWTQETLEYLQRAIASMENVDQQTATSIQLSQDTIQEALAGQQAVEHVMRSMDALQDTMTVAVGNITGFAKHSQSIDTILEVIRDITEQTSLLSLNASIIAAQAGEHGRGFAVVANEIRSLSDGVKRSTKDIASIAHALQQETTQVIDSIHEGAKHADQGIKRTQQARETLHSIISSAERSSSVVSDIATTLKGLVAAGEHVLRAMRRVSVMTDDITSATKQHQAGTHLINQSIRQIDQMTSEIQAATTQQLHGVRHIMDVMNNVTLHIDSNLESSRHIMRTTQELSHQSELLLESVDRFKLT